VSEAAKFGHAFAPLQADFDVSGHRHGEWHPPIARLNLEAVWLRSSGQIRAVAQVSEIKSS
jgi:hypothetical protein